MKKHWAQTLLSLGIVLPGAAQALGLGNLIVLSGAGEPFQAEIPIVSAHSGELADMHAGIADPSAYAMIHLPEAASSRDWEFSLRAGSNPAIVIQSPAPLTSGNVPFLVQLDWAGGQIVREYRAVPGVAAARVRSTFDAPTSVAVPDHSANVAPRSRRGRPISALTVAEGSCLYSVAQTVSQERGVTLLQAMTGLFRENPQAFINGDPNLLRAGARLRVPSTGSMRAIAARESAALLRPVTAPVNATAAAQTAAQTAAVSSTGKAEKLTTPAVASSAAAQAGGLVSTAPTGSASSGKSGKKASQSASAPIALAASATDAVAAPTQSAPVTADAVSAKVVAADTSTTAGGDDAELQALRKALRLAQIRLNITQQQLAEKTAELTTLQRQTHSFPWLWVSLGANLLFVLALLMLLRRYRQAAAEAPVAPFATAEQDPRLGRGRNEPVVAAPPIVPVREPSRPAAETPPRPPVVPIPTAQIPAASNPTPNDRGIPERLAVPVTLPKPPPVGPSVLPPAEEDQYASQKFAVDPIEQAQLYSAYDKTDLAISVLQEAVEQDPQRRDLYEMLLPLYVKTGNHGAFLDLSDRLRDQFHVPEDSLPTWDELGQGEAPEVVRLPPVEPADLPPQAAFSQPRGLAEESKTSEEALQKLEFDFGGSWDQEEPALESGGRSLDSGLFAELGEHFKQLSSEADSAEHPEPLHFSSTSALSLGDPGDINGLSHENIVQSEDWDATGPKLELARAYLELKDAVSAKELLEEVQKSGNSQQQKEAAALLLEL